MGPSDPPEISNLPQPVESSGNVRRIGSISGFIMFLILDFLALDDITTAGAWMPEILVILCSIPALVTLGYYALKPRGPQRRLEGDTSGKALGPASSSGAERKLGG